MESSDNTMYRASCMIKQNFLWAHEAHKFQSWSSCNWIRYTCKVQRKVFFRFNSFFKPTTLGLTS